MEPLTTTIISIHDAGDLTDVTDALADFLQLDNDLCCRLY